MKLFCAVLAGMFMCCLVSGQVVSSDGQTLPGETVVAEQPGVSDAGAASGDAGTGGTGIPVGLPVEPMNPSGPIAGLPYEPGTEVPILSPAPGDGGVMPISAPVKPIAIGAPVKPISPPKKPARKPQKPIKRKPQKPKKPQRKPAARPSRNGNRRGQNSRPGGARLGGAASRPLRRG